MWTKYTGIVMPISLVLMAGLAIMLWLLLKNKSAKAKLIPFMVLAVAFLALELSKQIYEIVSGYDLYSIPLHVCSFFVFLPVFAAFLKQQWKVTRAFWAVSVITATIVTIAMFISPEIIMGGAAKGVVTGSKYYLDYHSIIHHALIMLFLFMSMALSPWKPSLKDAARGSAVFGGFLILAWIMARVLDVNYSSFTRIGTNFWIQLAVWALHMVCYAGGAVLVYYAPKFYKFNKFKIQAKKANKAATNNAQPLEDVATDVMPDGENKQDENN